MSRSMTFLIFFSIVLLIYGSINYLIYTRGSQAIINFPKLKIWYTIIFITLASSYILARIMDRFMCSIFSDILTWIGSFWLAGMLYFSSALLCIDIIRLIAWILPGVHLSTLTNIQNFKPLLMAGIMFVVTILVTIGYFNATRPKITTLNLDVPAKGAQRKEVTIAMASDIHLGTLVAHNRLNRLITNINKNNPDIILLAGDIVDEDLAPVIRQNLGHALEQLKAPLGIWAITGNHEYIGGAEPAVKYLQQYGINFLRDTAVKIEDTFWLAGREDRDRPRFSGKKRKELNELINLTDNTLPIVLMDHQPFKLDQVAMAGVDLQLSGHTHNGQLWPLNYVTSAIFEKAYGYLKKENTHFYISSGFGTWGPPVRLSSRSEIVIIHLHYI